MTAFTVTVEPFTVTSRKWNTWLADAGFVAWHDDPLPLDDDHPIA